MSKERNFNFSLVYKKRRHHFCGCSVFFFEDCMFQVIVLVDRKKVSNKVTLIICSRS